MFHAGLGLAGLPGFPVACRNPATWRVSSPAEFSWGYHPSACGATAAAARRFSFDKLGFSNKITCSQKMAGQSSVMCLVCVFCSKGNGRSAGLVWKNGDSQWVSIEFAREKKGQCAASPLSCTSGSKGTAWEHCKDTLRGFTCVWARGWKEAEDNDSVNSIFCSCFSVHGCRIRAGQLPGASPRRGSRRCGGHAPGLASPQQRAAGIGPAGWLLLPPGSPRKVCCSPPGRKAHLLRGVQVAAGRPGITRSAKRPTAPQRPGAAPSSAREGPEERRS